MFRVYPSEPRSGLVQIDLTTESQETKVLIVFASLIAIFSAGTFFGAAVYISIAQHPASLEAGAGVAGRMVKVGVKESCELNALFTVLVISLTVTRRVP